MSQPLRYRDLSADERAAICNGCGAKGGWVPVPDFCFRASCDHHDFNYWLGCNRKDRLKADRQFYAAMRADAAALPWYRQPLAYTGATVYYLAVRACGWRAFHFADHERGREELEDQLKK